MPFQSKSQMRKCFALQNEGNKTWNCHKSYEGTKYKELPERKIFTGPKGGKYVLINGIKKYISKINIVK